MICVTKTITADDTDILASTDLANVPAEGQLDVFIASTQNDTLFTITGPGNETIIRNQKVQLRTNGMPSMDTDLPLSFGVLSGGHYFLDVNIQTAATVNVLVIHRNELDMPVG